MPTAPTGSSLAASSASSATPGGSGSAAPRTEHTIKETLISLIISFVMALVFRSYVVEAFVIPTGSMAPTLLGAHMHFKSDQSGYEWTVNPWWFADPGSRENPLPIQGQGPGRSAPLVTDPMSTSQVNSWSPSMSATDPRRVGYSPRATDKPLRAGDRILVFKFLYELFPPERYDVVVFKNPELAAQNFIKRLIGLPNEQIWIADGDIFARPIAKKPDGSCDVKGPWAIARKPLDVQRALWRPVYDTEFAPLSPDREGRRWFNDPWQGDGWTSTLRSYRNDAPGPSTLRWDSKNWPVWDWVSYNDFPGAQRRSCFPVSDVRMRAAVKPDQLGLTIAGSIRARGHEFQAVLGPGGGLLRMRPLEGDAANWTPVGTTLRAFKGFRPGRFTSIEFWHADQALELFVDGELIARGEYGWQPNDRLLHATGQPGDSYTDTAMRGNGLLHPETYAMSAPDISWQFEGAPVTLTRVGLDRDIYYEATQIQGGASLPGLGTHPARLATLGADQFFCLGDNSPFSKDGRLWTAVDPWVAYGVDPEVGVVNRDLMLGKAFYVYFPAPLRFPIPDFGRMRLIK